MTARLTCLFLTILTISAGGAGERVYINDKKAPENRKDIEAIQNAMQKALPQARAATVCVDLGNGSGTGVIVSAEGLVLTAAHVAGGIRRKVTVVMEDGTRLDAKTLGLVSDKDAAMIQITEKGNYPFVVIDRDNSTQLGDWVFALGHAGGFDKSRGPVVRLGRLVRIEGDTFQSDCILIGGDSGGPLFDLNGQVVGIHSRVGQQLQSNMHVPMTVFTANWDSMLKCEFLGDGPYAQKPEKGKGVLGLASEVRPEGGLIVTKVADKSAAHEAGIVEGDILHKLNGKPLEKHEQILDLLKEMTVGEELSLEVEHAGKTETLTITLGER